MAETNSEFDQILAELAELSAEKQAVGLRDHGAFESALAPPQRRRASRDFTESRREVFQLFFLLLFPTSLLNFLFSLRNLCLLCVSVVNGLCQLRLFRSLKL